MAIVSFTPNLARHVACPTVTAQGTTVAQVLDAVFRDNPRLRGYVLDDRGVLCKHMVVFLDGVAIADRERLSDAVPGENAEIVVMQRVLGIAGGELELAHVFSDRRSTLGGFDSVVLACGGTPRVELAHQLADDPLELHVLGDAYAPRRITYATHQASELAALLSQPREAP